LTGALLLAAGAAKAQESWALHGQATFLDQYHPAFHAAYNGPDSMDPGSRGNETFDATLFAGVSPWAGGEAWADLEVDQGFGLSDTVGIAAFPSGEAYKVGKSVPYLRLQRLFFRQSFDLGGEPEKLDSAANQLAGTRTADNLVITAGKFSVTDIFDSNSYAHDPKADFMNWAVIDSGGFDYAADAWGYSYGLAAEWNTGPWSLRAGLFDLSKVPNTTELETDFRQFELVAELERRYALGDRDGKIRLLGFVNRGDMADYRDATALAVATDMPADVALVRHYRSRPGAALNIEQSLSADLGAFLRASLNDGSKETYEFTDMQRSLAVGLSLKGTSWQREDDTIGLAVETSAISQAARTYFDHGGLGLLVGDGQLSHYRDEAIAETYYDVAVGNGVNLAADYQFVANPAYNADRGPISVLGFRLHTAL
jgi:high affinity Mn2+ porin